MELQPSQLFWIAITRKAMLSKPPRQGSSSSNRPSATQLKALERELNVQLFGRKARGVELTNAGRALLHDARAMLDQLERAQDTARRAARGEPGRLCVGVTSTTP